tara:strand:- start:241 stop:489 length:249 start_codon:yes stop_codon:yes gene_type:complete
MFQINRLKAIFLFFLLQLYRFQTEKMPPQQATCHYCDNKKDYKSTWYACKKVKDYVSEPIPWGQYGGDHVYCTGRCAKKANQ